MNQRGKRQIEKNVRKVHPRRRVQRRAPLAGSAAVDCEIVDCWRSSRGHSFLKVCIPADRGDACNAFGEAMVEKRKVTVLLPNAEAHGRAVARTVQPLVGASGLED